MTPKLTKLAAQLLALTLAQQIPGYMLSDEDAVRDWCKENAPDIENLVVKRIAEGW